MGNGGAVFLDRDGTINEDRGYVSDPDELVLLPGAAASIKRLNREGVKVIVITNQSGVGRGLYSAGDVRVVNQRLEELLRLDGARLDGVYYCPHRPDEGCGCRKPETGLIVQAAEEHSIDLESSFVVGDKASDIGLAKGVNARAVLVLTGVGATEKDKLDQAPDYVAEDLGAATEWILERL
jgi:histidinol-phosphate phosphatase family protein